MSTSNNKSASQKTPTGLPEESSDQLFTDRQLSFLLPGTWACMWGFIVLTQYYPRLIVLNWPLLLLFGYLYFVKSSP